MHELLIKFAGMLPTLLTGALIAVKITLGALLISVVGGLLLAVLRTFAPYAFVRIAISAYVEWMRNIPALAHLFILYFGLASLGLRLPALAAAIIGLGLVGSAVLCDVFRSGLRALHIGQREAALSVGLSPMQALLHILLPQALRTTLPPFGNFVTQLIKDTSIASAIAAPEIMFYARNLVTSTFETTLIYLAVMLIYLALIVPVGWLFARIEQGLRRAY